MEEGTVDREAIIDILRDLSREIRDLDTWPALSCWSEAYLREVAGAQHITVALTPNGRADCPTALPDGRPCFALPHQQKMPLAQFLDLLRASNNGELGSMVPYYQYQNSSLTEELPGLMDDIDRDLPFATEAFGGPPDAVNLWIGSPRSITSWHRDHYENLYAMVSGHKTFRLLPPSDSYRMALRRYPLAVYCPTVLQSEEGTVDPAGIDDIIAGTAGMGLEGVKKVELTPRLAEPHQEVLWSSITPRSLKPAGGNGTESSIDEGIERALQGGDEEAGNVPPSLFDDPQLPAPLEVTIGPGEMLYLPACWWHEVHHGVASGGDGSGGIDAVEPIIAVNFWYEMSFDARYASTKAVEALAERLGLNDASPAL